MHHRRMLKMNLRRGLVINGARFTLYMTSSGASSGHVKPYEVSTPRVDKVAPLAVGGGVKLIENRRVISRLDVSMCATGMFQFKEQKTRDFH
jgi:hypothetical protein